MGPLCILIEKKNNWAIITKLQELLQPAGYILQFVKKILNALTLNKDRREVPSHPLE